MLKQPAKDYWKKILSETLNWVILEKQTVQPEYFHSDVVKLHYSATDKLRKIDDWPFFRFEWK